MKRLIAALTVFGAFAAQAETLYSLDSLLEAPMEKRVKEYKNMGDKAHKFLAKTAFDRTEPLQTRWRAVTTMGKWDAMAFRPELDRALASSEWFMRNSALIALLNDERTRAVSWSVKMLEDRSLVVRTQAVRNLIGLGAIDAVPRLWSEVSARRNFRGEESLWIRAHIAEALARLALPEPQQSKNFQRLLMDRDERLHKWAIMGLEKTTGIRLSDKKEPVEIKRQKWLARLGVDEI
jgi:HEAT repeat protein